MNRTILYYPTIDIPQSNWLRHSLLYWDEVCSIVPRSWDDEILVELSPEIHYLMQEEQFRPIKPEDLIFKNANWEIFQQFQEEFKQIVSSQTFQKFIQKQHNSQYRIHINKVENNERARVHSNKTTGELFYFLEEEGLAKRNYDNPEWLIFEENTALLYMSLLAKYLADIDSEQTVIGTDIDAYEKFNFKRVTEKDGFPVIGFSLDKVLPTPNANVPLEKIIDFKRQRADNLSHFKKSISEFETKISKSKSQAELKEIAVTFQETLQNGVKDLRAVLGDSKIESTLKTFKSLISSKSPTLIATTGALINEKFNLVNIPFNWEAIGLAVVGTLELTCSFVELRNKNRAKLRESSFSYVYEAQRYGIIKGY